MSSLRKVIIYFKNPGTDQVDITRNEDYVIAKISHWGVEVTLKWKIVRYGDKQYITTFTSDEPDVTVVYYFFYDKGNMFSESIRNEWKDGRSNTYAEAVYKVLEKDKYGNWLKRKAVYNRNIVEIETCKLEYYPENMDENMNVDKSKIEGLQIKAHSEDMLATLVVAEEETAVLEAEDNEIYDKVETEPNFPGGMSAIFTHIAKKKRYPLIAAENGIEGKVIVSFVIEKNGSISNVKVAKGVNPDLDKEAVRVVKTLPNFTSPGKISEKSKRTRMNLPVTFKLK